MTARVTRRQAEAVLAAVRKRFSYAASEGSTGPTLETDWACWSSPSPYAVVWEEGPYEWAHVFVSGGVDEELAILAAEIGATVAATEPYRAAGVFLEPITSWAVGIYRDA